jgi:hypothetical protein
MIVRVPYDVFNGTARSAALFSCSVDAKWAMGDNIGSGLTGDTDTMIQSGKVKSTRPPTTGLASNPLESFLPVEGPNWRTVSISQGWLSTLTPQIDPNLDAGWTTLAKTFTAAGFDNSTGMVSNSWSSLGSTIETTIATVIVDGMSRIGLSNNGGNIYHVMDRYNWVQYMKDKNGQRYENWNRFLRGQDVVLYPIGVSPEDLTKLNWSVTVSGLAYQADSLPYYLALGVLLLHALLAVGHTVYMLYTRRSSDTWQTFEEMLILGQNSRPGFGGKLKNTCGGMTPSYPLFCVYTPGGTN